MLKTLDIEIIGTGETAARGYLEGELSVAESVDNVRNQVVLVNTDGEDLTLAVDSNDTAGYLVLCSHKDGLATDAVHVDAGAGLEVVEVDEAELCDQEDDAVLLTDLHGNREVAAGLWGEVNINSLLGVDRVSFLMINLDNVKLTMKV